MNTEPSNPTEFVRSDDRPTFRVPYRDVYDGGRIVIPSDARNKFDVRKGDVVDVRVATDEVVFWSLDLSVDGKGRIRIPKRKMRLYDVSDGDTVDLIVQKTNLTADE